MVEEKSESSVLQIEVEQLRQEVAELRDKYMRAIAESENRQKRLVREQRDLVRQAVADAVIQFLQPLDHMENALQFVNTGGSEELRNWARGFEMILAHFKEALAQQGIIAFDSHGKPFDPHKHEAVEMVETEEQPEGVIIEELHRGYEMEGRVLRPARVKVAKSPASDEEKSENQTTTPEKKDEPKK